MRISTWLKALLATVALFTVWFGLVPTVLGEDGLGLFGRAPRFLPPQTAITVPVVADRGFADRAQQTPPIFDWVDTSAGSKDSRTGLPPVELGRWHMDLALWGPSFTDRLLYATPRLILQALTLLTLLLLWRMVGTLATGEVFTRANARRMLAIGVTVGAGGTLVQLVRDWSWAKVIAHSAAAGVVQVQATISFVPLVIGAVILLFAEVFRQGVRLRSEVDGLI